MAFPPAPAPGARALDPFPVDLTTLAGALGVAVGVVFEDGPAFVSTSPTSEPSAAVLNQLIKRAAT